MLIYYKTIFLLGAITAFVVAIFILLEGGKKVANRNFFVVTILSAVWSFGFYQLVSASSLSSAIFWRWFMESGSILLPIWWLKFVYEFLEISSSKRILTVSYIVGGLVWTLNFADLYIPGVFVTNMGHKLIFNYYPTAGLGYYLFSFYFAFIIFYSLSLVYKEFRKNSGTRARQIEFVLFAAALGFVGGGMTFLPTLNILISPVGVIFFSIYPAIIAYAILKHQLFSLRLVLVELAILLLNMFLLFNVFTSQSTVSFVLNISISAFVLIFSIFLLRGIYKDIRDRERIEELAKEMAVTNEKLHILEQQKTEFVSIASHQLRTPLTVIKGYASMILEGTFGTIADPVKDAIGKLYKSSERIVALVEDLLTVSRLEQGRGALHLETVDLVRVVQMVTMEMDEDIKRSSLDFSFTVEEGGEFPVSIDEKKFKQVVRHILDNAIEYTSAPGKVRIAINEDDIADKIRLTVSDTGVGMTAEQIKTIFERFNLKINSEARTGAEGEEVKSGKLKVESGIQESKPEEQGEGGAESGKLKVESSAEKNVKGAEEETPNQRTPGIGLYIAQEILEAHHGTLHIASAGMNEGTTVIVEMPSGEGNK